MMSIMEMTTSWTAEELGVSFGALGWLPFALAIATGVITVLQSVVERRVRERRRAKLVKIPLEDKLKRVQELSTQLAAINAEVQAEFALQAAATEQAKRESRNAAALAALSEEQRDAAARLVQAQIGEAFDRNTRSERWFQVALALGSFIAGVVATLVLT